MLHFRLRTLLIVVAVLAVPCAWVGYSLRWIEKRHALCDNGALPLDLTSAPAGLWIFGAQGAKVIIYGWTDEEKREAESLFPEARVIRGDQWNTFEQ
jgi:hypothetical protein